MIIPQFRKMTEEDKLRAMLFNLRLYGDIFSKLNGEKKLEFQKKQEKRIDTAIRRGLGFVATIGNSPQAPPQAHMIMSLSPGQVSIEDLYVHDFFRGMSIGKGLVRLAALEANNRVYQLSATLFPQNDPLYAPSLNFYRSLGFELKEGGYCASNKVVLKELARLVHSS